VCHI
ncbi:tail assembly protein, partial [Escherichia coli EC1849]